MLTSFMCFSTFYACKAAVNIENYMYGFIGVYLDLYGCIYDTLAMPN